MKLVIEYSPWFVLLCLVAGAVYAFALYYKERKNDFSKKLKFILGIFRFIAVSLICILLLSPLLRSVSKIYQKPLIIFAQDNSESIKINGDSAYYKKDYPGQVKTLFERFENDYELIPLSFGSNVSQGFKSGFTDARSDIGMVINEIISRYSYAQSAAVILASDGIYNMGSNPIYAAENWKMPVYTIAMGDTIAQVDALIEKVNFNRVVFTGNMFPAEVLLKAVKLKGKPVKLDVFCNDELIESQSINISSDRFYRALNFTMKAGKPGIVKYTVKISETEGELTYQNNISHFFVEIIENKQKVMILYDAPHPDISAIKQVLAKNINYEVSTSRIGEFSKNVKDFDVFVFYQLPSLRTNPFQLLKAVMDEKIPALYITGPQINTNSFNNLNTGVQISGGKGGSNESQPSPANDFSLFSLAPKTMTVISAMPPLLCPFGNYRLQGSADVLLYQKIRGISTTDPLLMFNDAMGRRTALISGEGIWKWRMQNFLKEGNHDAFDDLIGSVFQYLSVRTDNSRFAVYNEDIYNENTPVLFTAELYNESYQLINEPEVNISISGRDNRQYPYTFSRTGNAYSLDIGLFPPGEYRYIATTKSGSKTLSDEGRFIVAPVNLESINTTADHNLLYNLAAGHGGKMYYPRDMDALYKEISGRNDLKTTYYSRKKFNEMLNLPWVLGLLIFLFAMEWFLRKRSGAY